ncbi:MAG TPA: arsenite methyltransferase [Ktedonobacteraceae bacterium]|jgi:SAM-dependent methyltransferase
MQTVPHNDEQLRQEVSARYARIALQIPGTPSGNAASCCTPGGTGPAEAAESQPVSVESSSSCCASSCCTTNAGNPITSDLYTQLELGELPVAAALASLGCGNPTALAELKPGEKVLDLGSGGGIDVLLSARRVGPTGFAYGLDMTDPMLELAERNRQDAGVENVRFLKGIIEAIPLPDNSVDVVISNCVINLSADKGQVLREAYRVLTAGGRFAVSDIVVQGDLPPILRRDMESWAGCIAGALEEHRYRALLQKAGFIDIEIEVTRRYSLDEVDQSGASSSLETLAPEERRAVDGRFVSAFVRASKPHI